MSVLVRERGSVAVQVLGCGGDYGRTPCSIAVLVLTCCCGASADVGVLWGDQEAARAHGRHRHPLGAEVPLPLLSTLYDLSHTPFGFDRTSRSSDTRPGSDRTSVAVLIGQARGAAGRLPERARVCGFCLGTSNVRFGCQHAVCCTNCLGTSQLLPAPSVPWDARAPRAERLRHSRFVWASTVISYERRSLVLRRVQSGG